MKIPGTDGTRYFESGYPGFGITGFAAFGSTESYMPYYQSDPQLQYVDNANWLKASHNIRFGMDLSFLQLNHAQPEFAGAAGRLNFGQGPTQLRLANGNVTAGNEFNAMGTYLLGLVDGGTRMERFPMPVRENRGMERYDFATNEMLVCGTGGIPADCGTKLAKLLFSPRLGIAYRLNDKTVVRTGFGLNWDPWNLARPLRTNYPILAASNLAPAGPVLGYHCPLCPVPRSDPTAVLSCRPTTPSTPQAMSPAAVTF